MVRNYYRITERVSSGQEELDYSLDIVDDLLRKNGYSNPRDHIKTYNKKQIKNVNRTFLELPFISDRISNQIRYRAIPEDLRSRPTLYLNRKKN